MWNKYETESELILWEYGGVVTFVNDTKQL
jgi:hypothetical protein